MGSLLININLFVVGEYLLGPVRIIQSGMFPCDLIPYNFAWFVLVLLLKPDPVVLIDVGFFHFDFCKTIFCPPTEHAINIWSNDDIFIKSYHYKLF